MFHRTRNWFDILSVCWFFEQLPLFTVCHMMNFSLQYQSYYFSLPSRYCVVIGFIFSLNPHSLLYVFVNNLSRFFLSNNQWNYDKFTNNLSTNRNYVGLVVAVVLFPVLIFWRNPSHCHSHNHSHRCHNTGRQVLLINQLVRFR